MVSGTSHTPCPQAGTSPSHASMNLMDTEKLEAKFAVNLFDDILPGTVYGHRTRAIFRWPIDVTAEDCLLVVLQCMKKAGFDTIGDLLATMFSKDLQDSGST